MVLLVITNRLISLQFNNTTTENGIIQRIEDELSFPRGHISGNTAMLKRFLGLINSTLDDYIELAIKSSGTWQFDDSNHTDFPIITTNIVASQRDYTFTTDEAGNLILDVERVFVRNSTTDPYQEIYPVDVNSDDESVISTFADGLNTEGKPYKYDKLGNGILLDPIPNASVTNGLKVYINREGYYFTTSDTTRKPGVPGIHHEYFVLKPAFKFAKQKMLANAVNLEKDVLDFEGSERLGVTGKIPFYFAKREKDVRHKMTPKKINYV